MHTATIDDAGSLPYVLVQPDGYEPGVAYPLVVLLHGFGASMHDLVGLAAAVDSTGYQYAFPNAPYRVDLGGGETFSWSASRPGAAPPPAASATEAPQPFDDLDPVEALLDAFIAELMAATGVTPGRVVLGGFSQGGGLALRYGLLRPKTFAGLAVLSGAFRDADDLRARLPAERAQPVFVGHGVHDPRIAIERGRETRAFLEAEGYAPVYREYAMSHAIAAEEVADLTAWLHAALPPKS